MQRATTRKPDRQRKRRDDQTTLLLLLITMILPMSFASKATAGCGCDHPPPEWTPVMPIFAPPGAEIRIFAQGDTFDVGDHYQIRIGGSELRNPIRATNPGYIEAIVPDGTEIGPASIEVYRKSHSWLWGSSTRYWARYDDAAFTVLSHFVEVPAKKGVYESEMFDVAIDASGTVLLPIDLSNVLNATQFAFQFEDFRLSFEPEDIVMYNKDGVDLTLFTLAVNEGTRRTWGSYYGWEVQEDKDIRGIRYQNRTGRAWNVSHASDILTYWRHEFRTYAFAHMKHMSYAVDGDGYHPDASLHIDHDYVIIAFHGAERNAFFPDLERFDRDLAPGRKRVRLSVAARVSLHPVEPEIMIPMVEKARRPESLERYLATRPEETLELKQLDEWLDALSMQEQAAALEKLDMTYEEAVLVAEEHE